MRTEEKNMHNNQQGAPSHLLDRFPGAPVTRENGYPGVSSGNRNSNYSLPSRASRALVPHQGPSSRCGITNCPLQIHPQRGNLMVLIILRDDESRTLPGASLIVVLFRYLASFQISSLPRPDHETHWPLFLRCSM